VIRTLPGLKAGTTLSEALRMVAQSFRLSAIESPDADARLLIGQALRLDRSGLLAEEERNLDAREVDAISLLAARRLKREPVARILGRKEFWSLSLEVSPAVLVPRPDSETLIEAALDFVVRGGLRMEALRILDIGTGSGALLLALLSELPNAVGTGTDISAPALAIARANAERHGLAARCAFVECDIAAALSGPFDLIVSNPPYVAHGDIATLEPEVRDYDPALALDGGIDGLDGYRAIANDARRLLAPGGRLIVELGAGQEPAVRPLFTDAGLTVGSARDDLAGIPRALSAFIAPQTAS
jgi:release factor glutamine methyltransferase